MDNKTSFDRSLFIPIFIGFFSVLGICLVLIASRLSAVRGPVRSTDTATPEKFQFLATEPGIVYPTAVASPTDLPATEIPIFVFPTTTPFLVRTPILSTPISTSNGQPFATSTITPSPISSVQPLNITYDDNDFKFLYTGNWVAQTGVTGAYQNTLHISSTIGDAVQLSFVGQKILFTYQAGPSLGTVAIKLDSADFSVDQAATETTSSVWESPVLILSSHTITITHISGGSVNLDFIAVPDISTPTPTPTITVTP